jgi:hypothetical protein
MICPDCDGFGDLSEDKFCHTCNGWGHLNAEGFPKRPCPKCYRHGCACRRQDVSQNLPPQQTLIGHVTHAFPGGIIIHSPVYAGETVPSGEGVIFYPVTD